MKSRFIIVLFLSLVSLCNAQTVWVYLYTPNGSQVSAIEYAETLSANDIAEIRDSVLYWFPNVEILAPATNTYNCHSYAWNMIEGGPICWLETYYLRLYWDDGSYSETTEANAERIFYYAGEEHSAVKSPTHPGKYESKWGILPLVRHSPGEGPVNYKMENRRYYRKYCETIVNFTNHLVDTQVNVKSCGDIYVENVYVGNSFIPAKLTLNAPGPIIIERDFSVGLGAELKIK